MNDEQLQRIATGHGFVAALDQSGGSTPRALRLYGIDEHTWSGEDEMFDLVHEMRTRILTSPVFTGDRILAAILFEQTMERQVGGLGTAEYLWQEKRIVPFLKVDRGLADEADGVRLMKPIPDLDGLLERAVDHGVRGTKMRSVITLANPTGIAAVVEQQLRTAQQILAAGLVPIVEPEVDIHSPEKARAEEMLRAALLSELDLLDDDQHVMLKLTLPEVDGLLTPLVEHPAVLRVAALSGGYRRAEANARLARQPGVIASFSRALTEGLTAQQDDHDFDAVLDESIAEIFAASVT
ncbi:fructose bisphosphate aldolase [Actinotalea sp. K2]|uniref:fructose bisphosphate aldolase n=1 Tax=Actinotalea sp. K2 TaxID=2939438 RepID=UPI0020178372|nr:fructose bisphosphate aldolase [Actinotalea sp. K2]MCL3862485.1 fructose bisphosphate aldolase [Actinotalea sp. K2]